MLQSRSELPSSQDSYKALFGHANYASMPCSPSIIKIKRHFTLKLRFHRRHYFYSELDSKHDTSCSNNLLLLESKNWTRFTHIRRLSAFVSSKGTGNLIISYFYQIVSNYISSKVLITPKKRALLYKPLSLPRGSPLPASPILILHTGDLLENPLPIDTHPVGLDVVQ